MLSLVSAEETIFIRNQTMNATQIEFIFDTLRERIDYLENPIDDNSCRYIISQLNSNIVERNLQIEELNQKLSQLEYSLNYHKVYIALLIICFVLLCIKRVYKLKKK